MEGQLARGARVFCVDDGEAAVVDRVFCDYDGDIVAVALRIVTTDDVRRYRWCPIAGVRVAMEQ